MFFDIHIRARRKWNVFSDPNYNNKCWQELENEAYKQQENVAFEQRTNIKFSNEIIPRIVYERFYELLILANAAEQCVF